MEFRPRAVILLLVGGIIGAATLAIVLNLQNGVLTIEAALSSLNVLLTVAVVASAYETIRAQVKLHHAANRPYITCELAIVNMVIYLRIRNAGNSAALDTKVEFEFSGEGKSVEKAKKNLDMENRAYSYLPPGYELFYFMDSASGISHFNLTCKLTYLGGDGIKFDDQIILDTKELGPADIGRENNSPEMRHLERIAKSLEQIERKME